MINETEAERAFNGNGSTSMMFAFLTGASIGAAAGLLLAPRPGRESRDQLRTYVRKTGEKFRAMGRQSAEWAEQAAGRMGEAATDVMERNPKRAPAPA